MTRLVRWVEKVLRVLREFLMRKIGQVSGVAWMMDRALLLRTLLVVGWEERVLERVGLE